MATEPPARRRFGKYLLLDLIATGGMAEIYLAKLSGEESFERLLAIKCIRPELAKDPTFVEMFANEARLAGQLSHPNLVQIFELGRVEEQLYIAMELVEGRDLRNIIDRAAERGETIPVPFAAHVIRQAAEGLDHAHHKLGTNGEPLGLIHRDVSPQNLIVAWQGAVKVVDFGIAMATDSGVETQVGILEGKFDYLAPEQVYGKHLDRRVDIFALGNVLYEAVTGTKLFGGDGTNDFDVLSRAKTAELPDFATALPDAPAELIEVLSKACAAKPQDRYGWAAEMAKAMDPLLIEGRSIFAAAEAAEYLEQLYADEREADRIKAETALRAVAQQDAAAQLDAMEFSDKTETFMSAFGGTADLTPELAAIRPAEVAMPGAFSMPGAAPATPVVEPSIASGGMAIRKLTPLPVAPTRRRSRRWLAVYIVAGGLAVGTAAGWFLGGPTPESSPTSGEPGIVPAAPQTSDTPPAPGTATPTTREPGPTDFGYLRIRVRRGKGAKVFLDGEPLGRTPRKAFKVSAGIHTVRVQRGAKIKERTVTVGPEHTRQSPASTVIGL